MRGVLRLGLVVPCICVSCEGVRLPRCPSWIARPKGRTWTLCRGTWHADRTGRNLQAPSGSRPRCPHRFARHSLPRLPQPHIRRYPRGPEPLFDTSLARIPLLDTIDAVLAPPFSVVVATLRGFVPLFTAVVSLVREVVQSILLVFPCPVFAATLARNLAVFALAFAFVLGLAFVVSGG